MESVTTMPRRGQGLTRADLAAFPDDGWRYELLDGMLLVSPSPSLAHQRAALNLAVLLHGACPDELYVMVAPFDVTLADDTVFIPDLLVAPRADFTAKDLPGAPLLAVEILSPSTRLVDRNVKKARFEEAGCASFWLVDPLEPRLTVWQLDDGRYREVADVAGDQTWTASAPFGVTITPSDLVD